MAGAELAGECAEAAGGNDVLMAISLHPSFAVHPGEWLRTEIVAPTGLTITVIAEKLGVTRQAMRNLLNGNAGLSAEMALRFEKAFGLRAETLLRMQTAHDLAAARADGDAIRVERVGAAA